MTMIWMTLSLALASESETDPKKDQARQELLELVKCVDSNQDSSLEGCNPQRIPGATVTGSSHQPIAKAVGYCSAWGLMASDLKMISSKPIA